MIGACAVCGCTFSFTKPVTHRATCEASSCRRTYRTRLDRERARAWYAANRARRLSPHGPPVRGPDGRFQRAR